MTGAVRRAQRVDVDDLRSLESEARMSVQDERGGTQMLADGGSWNLPDRVRSGEGLVLVATIDDVPLGFVSVILRRPDLAVIEALYVVEGARGVGLGEGLMDEALVWCRQQGARAVDSLALPGARATKNFYEAHGIVARAIVVSRRL